MDSDNRNLRIKMPLFLQWIQKNQPLNLVIQEWNINKKKHDVEKELLEVFGDNWETMKDKTQELLTNNTINYYEFLEIEASHMNFRNVIFNYFSCTETLLRNLFETIRRKIPKLNQEIVAEEEQRKGKQNLELIRYLKGKSNELNISSMIKAVHHNNKIRYLFSSVCILDSDKEFFLSQDNIHNLIKNSKITDKDIIQIWYLMCDRTASNTEILKFFDFFEKDYWNKCFTGGIDILNKIRSQLVVHNSEMDVNVDTMKKFKEVLIDKQYQFVNRIVQLTNRVSNEEILKAEKLI